MYYYVVCTVHIEIVVRVNNNNGQIFCSLCSFFSSFMPVPFRTPTKKNNRKSPNNAAVDDDSNNNNNSKNNKINRLRATK